MNNRRTPTPRALKDSVPALLVALSLVAPATAARAADPPKPQPAAEVKTPAAQNPCGPANPCAPGAKRKKRTAGDNPCGPANPCAPKKN
jgi:hypothetical protein